MEWYQLIPDIVQAIAVAGSLVLAVLIFRRSRDDNKD